MLLFFIIKLYVDQKTHINRLNILAYYINRFKSHRIKMVRYWVSDPVHHDYKILNIDLWPKNTFISIRR